MRGIDDLLRHQKANPTSWQALWIAGKGRQALGDHAGAAEAFSASFAQQPENPNVGREYAQALIELGKYGEAEKVERTACEASPKDAGLVANLALILLLAGRLEEAEQVAARSVRMAPTDPINSSLLERIQGVRAGRQPQPRSLADLEGRR